VIISVTEANDGPVCTIPPQPCGPPQAFASAYNPAGKDVWDAGAHKTFPGTHITCPGPGPVPSWTWAGTTPTPRNSTGARTTARTGSACRVTRIRAVRILRCPPAHTGSSVNSTGATGAPPATVRQRRPPSPSPARPRSMGRGIGRPGAISVTGLPGPAPATGVPGPSRLRRGQLRGHPARTTPLPGWLLPAVMGVAGKGTLAGPRRGCRRLRGRGPGRLVL